MNDNSKVRKILSISSILFIVMLLVSGSSYAYLTWQSATGSDTEINFTATQHFSCSADGGGNITEQDAYIIPSSCSNEIHTIKREIKVKPNIIKNNAMINLDLYLDVNLLDSGLSNSQNFNYVLSTSNASCTDGIVASGNFKSKSAGNKIQILDKDYNTTLTDTYYLYIWLDKAETNSATMDQKFNLSLSGSCEEIGSASSETGEPNVPVLDEGMIPVKIANNGTVTTVAENDSSWYNYENKEWANVVLVNSSSRSNYKGTNGITINQSDILAYYVWIPRYSYKIPEKKCSNIENPTIEKYPECYKYSMSENDKNSFIVFVQYVVVYGYGESDFTLSQAEELVNLALETGKFEGTTLSFLDGITMYNDNMDPDIEYEITFMPNKIVKSIAGRTIDISFESKDAPLLPGDAINSYRTHPAFTFGTENLSGIWVGKFETTGDSTTPTILPNLYSNHGKSSISFQTSLKFAGGTLSNGIVSFAGSDTYGLTQNTDSHMMKNSEWGAVAYLSYSIYGINSHIRGNSNGFLTGCGSLEENFDKSTSECQMAYGSVTSYPQSTTGNISGVFDMSGGNFKSVMGVFADENGNPKSGEDYTRSSGFNGMLKDGTLYSDGIDFPPSKYYDLYTSNDWMTACNGGICYGHALSETYDDYTSLSLYIPKEEAIPRYWILRSGSLSAILDYEIINTAFNFIGGDGSGYDWLETFYTVLVVD